MQHAVIGTQQTENREHGLGRLPAIDHRDRLHLMAAPPKAEIAGRMNRHWRIGKVLDQGSSSMCVAYSTQQFLMSSPIRNKPFPVVEQLYEACQEVDEWPGSDYDGTSVRAAMKILQADGLITEYTWAFDSDAVVRHLLGIGPVILGTDWYSGMWQADAEGFIHPEGRIVGGHAYMACGVNLTKRCPDGSKGALRIVNSWGVAWGQRGYAWLSLKDFGGVLLPHWGEAATAMECKGEPDFKLEAELAGE